MQKVILFIMSQSTNGLESNSQKKTTMGGLLKEFWTIYFLQAIAAVSVAGLMLNMVGISEIIWPFDSFHSIELGFLTGIKTIAVAIMGIVFGILADKFARKKIMVLVLFLMGVGRFLNGFVPLYELDTFLLFLLFYIILGIGQGGVKPIIFSISNDSISQQARSRFFGVLEVVYQFSLMAGMVVSAFLIQSGLWRIYYWSTGILLFICGFIILFFLKEPKRGLMHEELIHVLSNIEAKYEYKLTKETIRSTIFSPTNILAFVEGIFTWILFSIAIYLIYPYIQSEPHNVSPVASSLLMIVFGLPGAIIGSLTFSKLSDRLGEKDIIWRVYMIVSSMIGLFLIILLLFIVPFPNLYPWEGDNILNLFKYPIFLVFAVLLFLLRAVLVIYNINQNPILQKINLPEAQGTISSWNQFLEYLGFGLGPIFSGILLSLNNYNYTNTAIFSLLLGIPGLLLWLLAKKWIHEDVERVNSILKERAFEISNNIELVEPKK
ncbi:MAG: MFS transporter [Candidatus Helarchaeota archaeon]